MIAQNYSVSSYQKINEINGAFSGNLNNEDFFGISIDYIGDLDGNGINDLAVGAYADDDGGFNRGAVWILFLDDNDQVISHTKISDTQGGFTGILDDDDRFGGAVSYLGDLNSDGLIELAVGADYDEDGGFWHGAVWILSLNSDGTVNSHSKVSDTQGGFTGVLSGEAIFGTDISNIGDLNGDGVQDLAVGSRRIDTAGPRRGSVWILFMNNDFSVNSHQQISDTQGNFSAILEYEDYFGGSVANIGDLNGDGVVDLVVGAYRDDDQISNSGSFYVLFLNTDGTVSSYQKVSNFEGGLSSQISQDALFGESIDGVVDIDNDGKIEIIVGAMRQNNPTLSVPTGGFFIIELNSDGTVSEEYFYSYAENCFSGSLENGDLFGGSVCFLNDDINNLKIAAGAYSDSENGFRKGAAWILNIDENLFNLESYTNPTDCGIADGSFTISGLTPNSSYTIDYTFEGSLENVSLVSDGSGMITISNLSSGVYNPIVVTEDATNCTDDLEEVELIAPGLMASINFINPTGCGSIDGEIIISGLNPNTNYTIDYTFEGSLESLSLVSDGSGMITISNLSSGVYNPIVVTEDATNCTDDLDAVELIAPGLMASINFINPTDCGSIDGEIIISGLNPNTNYTIDYTFEGSLESLSLVSDGSGMITISNLSSGVYNPIVVTEDATNCTDDLDAVELIAPGLMASINFINPTDCGSIDGEIIISGLNPNTNYTIDYTFEGSLESLSLVSDGSGMITISNLSSGVYNPIVVTEDATNCTDDLDAVELIAPGLTATISFTNPTDCGVADGSFTISGLTPNSSYTIDYTFGDSLENVSLVSDGSGMITISNLSSGVYNPIVVVTEDATNCTDDLDAVELIAPGLTATISFTNPTDCGIADGSFTISGLTPNSSYTIDYTFEGSLENVSLVSDDSGMITISNLSSGVYGNISLTDSTNNCSINFGVLELDCDDSFECFRTRKFFTPNGDGYKDYWYLEQMSNECVYILYIFDRYGKLLTTLTPEDDKWDGTYNGAKMPSNDYWYLVKYVNSEGDHLEYRSHFSLKR